MDIPRGDKQRLHRFARLSENQDFIDFLVFLKEEYKKQSEINDIERDDIKLRQGQGQAQLLKRLPEIIKESYEIVLHDIRS